VKQPPKKNACVKKRKMQLAWQLIGRDNRRYTREKLKTVCVLDTESVTLFTAVKRCWWKLDDNKFSFFFVHSLGLVNYEIVAF
jgi:hypothetical protein